MSKKDISHLGPLAERIQIETFEALKGARDLLQIDPVKFKRSLSECTCLNKNKQSLVKCVKMYGLPVFMIELGISDLTEAMKEHGIDMPEEVDVTPDTAALTIQMAAIKGSIEIIDHISTVAQMIGTTLEDMCKENPPPKCEERGVEEFVSDDSRSMLFNMDFVNDVVAGNDIKPLPKDEKGRAYASTKGGKTPELTPINPLAPKPTIH